MCYCKNVDILFTFIAISDGKEVDIVRISVKEEQWDPAVAAVDRHDEQDTHDPTLLRRVRVPAQVLVNLQWIENITLVNGTQLDDRVIKFFNTWISLSN